MIQKATAVETATRESKGVYGAAAEHATSKKLLKVSTKPEAKSLCYRCGRPAHQPTHCKYKTSKCQYCQKVGHLASVCCSKQPADRLDKDLFRSKHIVLKFIDMHKQDGSNDFGVFSIAYAVTLCLSEQPGSFSFDQKVMCKHLLECLHNQPF